MKNIITLIIILISSLSYCQEKIYEKHVDKFAHAGVGSLTAAGSSLIYDLFKSDETDLKTQRKHKRIIGIASSILVGTLKEVFDSRKGSFDGLDLGATVLGGVVVVITF